MIKIVLLIDSLSSGGAQRQMVGLAKLLVNRQFKIKVITYYNIPFYAPFLEENNVDYACIPGADKKRSRLLAVHKYLVKEKADCVISYLDTPNILLILCRLFGLKSKIIVSERNTTQRLGIREKFKFWLYPFADAIVCNSQSQFDFISSNFKYLRRKLVTITNFVDLNYFSPDSCQKRDGNSVRILVVARLSAQKNALNFVEAISVLRSSGYFVQVDWYGNFFLDGPELKNKTNYYFSVRDKIEKCNADSYFTLHSDTRDILSAYQSCDVFALPSFYEGFPNVICEAMACGKPILASNVCDNKYLVTNGVNGYLFNPWSIKDMTNTIIKMLELEENLEHFGVRSREMAEEFLNEYIFLSQYEDLIVRVTSE